MYTCYSTHYGHSCGIGHNSKSAAQVHLRTLQGYYYQGHVNLGKFDELKEVTLRKEAIELQANPMFFKWYHARYSGVHLRQLFPEEKKVFGKSWPMMEAELLNKPKSKKPLEKTEKPQTEDTQKTEHMDSILNLDALATAVSQKLDLAEVQEKANKTIAEVPAQVAKVAQQETLRIVEDQLEAFSKQTKEAICEQLAQTIAKGIEDQIPKKVVVQLGELPEKKLSTHVHQAFDRVLKLAAMRENVLLVGPAGCGKTTLAKQISDVLNLPFYAISLSGGTTESTFKGRYIPSGEHGKFEFQQSSFITFYEAGGVVLLDEMDACDENVLVSINTALDNGYLDLPDRASNPVAKKHPDFVCIASANTYGHGANRMYCGRNQLDGATLDRFLAGLVEVDYDKDLEKVLISNGQFRSKVWSLRDKVNKKKLRRIVSTRVASKLDNQIAAGILTEQLAIKQITCGWSEDELAAVR